MKDSLCEEKTYTRVFQEYIKTLHSYLYFKTGSMARAHDLAQEAFTKLWQNCASVLPATAKGYVFKIANNLLINEHKHQKIVLQHKSQVGSQASVQSPEFLLEEKEFKAKLEAALASLPEKQRTVFLLSRIEKKTYQEIAELEGVSKKAVEKRMYLALDTLRTLVSDKIK